MKIACFTDSYLPMVNGVSFSVDVFAGLMAEKGDTVEIYAPIYEGTTKEETGKRKIVRRWYSVSLPTYREWRFVFPDMVKIFNQVEEFNPDVVHIHTPGTLGLTGILIAKMLRKPVVGTYHSLLSEMLVYVSPRKWADKYLRAIDRVMSGVGVDLNLLTDKKNEAGSDSIPQRITWSLVNRVYGRCDIVVSPSEAIKRELIKRKMKRRVEVVSNGVDLEMFECKREFVPTGRIVHAGRLGFEKNLPVVLRSFARLLQTVPRAELVIAGDGPARAELEELSRKIGIESKVSFLGMVDRAKLPEVYRSGDVFVTASTMETQGMVVLEAMACGLPVLGVRKYALPDLVVSGRNGFLVKPGGEKQMAEKLEQILGNPEMMRRMGLKAREVAQSHDVKVMAQKLTDVYSEAMLIKFNGSAMKI